MANKNEAKVTFKAETDAFTDGIKAINTSIGAMNAQLKLNSAQLDGTSSDTEALRSNMKLLADAQASAGQKVELTRMKLESACAIFGGNSVEADRLRKSLALAELQEANLGKKLDAASAALDAQESAFGQLSGTIQQQEGQLDELKRAYVNVVLEQGSGSESAKELAGQITALSRELEGNQAILKEAADAADQLTRSTQDTAQAAEEAEGDAAFEQVANLPACRTDAKMGNLQLRQAPAEVEQPLDLVNDPLHLLLGRRDRRDDGGFDAVPDGGHGIF